LSPQTFFATRRRSFKRGPSAAKITPFQLTASFHFNNASYFFKGAAAIRDVLDVFF
jgi:hypothetical protein